MSKQIIILVVMLCAAWGAKSIAAALGSPLTVAVFGSWENALHVSFAVLAFVWYTFEACDWKHQSWRR